MKGEGIMETRLLGYYGEQAAMDYIRHQTDYRIRCCNYRNRMGEIDIIADHGRTLVFIEVWPRADEQPVIRHVVHAFFAERR